MELCNSCNIAYEEKYCPLCEAKAEIEELKKELERERNSHDR